MNTLFSKNRIKWVLKIWLALTVLITINNGFFYINDYVSKPQHGLFDDFEDVKELILSSSSLIFYYLFFILDLIWSFLLLVLLGSLLRKSGILLFKQTIYKWFFGFAIFAYTFDVIENLLYISFNSGFLKTIEGLKLLCFGICLAIFVYWLIKEHVLKNTKNLLRFVQTNLFSLLFIGLIYGLLTAMPQGGTIVVDMFFNTPLNLFNIILLFFLLSFLAIIISHYPVYIDIWLNGSNQTASLEMAEKEEAFRFLGFGIIYYNTTVEGSKEEKARFNNQTVKDLRRSLGVLLYVAMFNVFLGTAARYFEWHIDVNSITFAVLVLALYLYNREGDKFGQWKSDIKNWESHIVDGALTNSISKKAFEKCYRFVRPFPWFFGICVVMTFISGMLAVVLDWHWISVMVFLLTLMLQLVLFVYFKIVRSFLKYVFYSDRLYQSKPEMFTESTVNFLYDLQEEYGLKLNSDRFDSWFFRRIGGLSNNVYYLKLMRLSGLLALIILIAANCSFDISSWLNPINVITLYIILYYSLSTILFKHILYYHRNQSSWPYFRNAFRYLLPVILIGFVGWVILSAKFKNDLHELQLVQNENALDHETYFKNLTQNNNRNLGKDNYFFVGSYGGGLKANLWNLLLFNELEKRTNGEFMERTAVLSGVSGGAVGIGNYSAIRENSENIKNIDNLIFNIGKSNVLSNELVCLFGKDWLKEYIPFEMFNGEDRSFYSMKHHAKLTNMNLYNEISFYDYWHSIYKNNNRKFPILIMNTTSTLGKQGVAASVVFPDSIFPFPAADNILQFKDKDNSLTYFGAVSTTNRFPLFSPSAKIKGRGSYLDGGYFENSGMLSALEMYKTIEKDTDFNQTINPIFINIINSQDFYINEIIKAWDIKPKDKQETGEFAAVLETVVSIEKLPRYVTGLINKEGYKVVQLMMPHKLSYNKVKSVLKSEVEDPLGLMKLIKIHNDSIDASLERYSDYKSKWGVVEPPLARLLSEPSVRYQEAMVKEHYLVKRAFDSIEKYLKAKTILKYNPVEQYNDGLQQIQQTKLNSLKSIKPEEPQD